MTGIRTWMITLMLAAGTFMSTAVLCVSKVGFSHEPLMAVGFICLVFTGACLGFLLKTVFDLIDA
jgi:hypothetical protein